MHIDAREYAKQSPGVLEAPTFTDLDGAEFRRERPLSILEYNDLEADWHAFLADAASGLLVKEDFKPRATTMIQAMGWPAERVLALPNDLFWNVMGGFFDSPKAEGEPPARATETQTNTAPSSQTTPAASVEP